MILCSPYERYLIEFASRCPGGELWTYDQGPLDVKNQWVGFDGNLPHGTLCFTGTRYSLIYFTISRVSSKEKDFVFVYQYLSFNLFHGIN